MPKHQMWFGTLERMRWIPVPLRGADMSPAGWGEDGTLLTGGGYVDHSWGSHKNYVFEWKDTSSREAAQIMKSYRDGTFGRGPLYFVDPLIYDRNILPAHWADPSMGVGSGARSLVAGLHPTGTATTDGDAQDLPVTSAVYDLGTVASGYRGDYESVFIPIPPDMTLLIGAQYSATGSGGIFVSPADADGTVGAGVALEPLDNDSTVMVNASVTGEYGVRVWVGKSSASSAVVTIAAMTARLVPTSVVTTLIDTEAWVDNGDGTWTAPGLSAYDGLWSAEEPVDNEDGTWTVKTIPLGYVSGPWIGGMGHSGVKFVGTPTWVANGPLDGGQIGYAATFKEVGSWL